MEFEDKEEDKEEEEEEGKDEISDIDIFRDIAIDDNIFSTSIDGKEKIIIGEHYGNHSLFSIDLFVKEVLNSNWPAFLIDEKIPNKIRSLDLARHYRNIDHFIDQYSEDKLFSPYVNLFFNSLKI